MFISCGLLPKRLREEQNMKKRVQKLVLLALSLSIAAGVATGCKEKDDPINSQTTGGDETNAETKLDSSLPAVDYEGYTFVFADDVRRNSDDLEEIYAEAESEDALNAAVYQRNSLVEEKYNISFVSNKDINLYNSLKSQEDICDAAIYGPYQVKDCMAEGLLVNLNEYDDIFNFDQPWWMGSISKEISFGDRLYIMAGDANVRALWSVNAMCYNKQLAAEYCEAPDFYGMVDGGSWTYEEMNRLAKMVGGEVNGDNILDENDRYGHVGNNFASIAFFYGCGCRFVTKDEDGEIVKNFGDEKQIEVLTSLVELINDKTMYFNGEPYNKVVENGRVNVPRQIFAQGRALFITELIAVGSFMRTIEQDYGILPVPKYDEAQDDYISYLHGNASYMSIPITVTNIERSARILEDMMFFSADTVRHAYIDITLKGKVAQANEDDVRMVETVYRNVTFDMGYFGVGSMDGDIRGMVDSNDTNFVSFFESNATRWGRMLDNYLRPYIDN